MVTTKYTHIWDCCCDHGLLGAALLARQAANNIHFVDIVPQLMTELENKLLLFYPSLAWQIHCIDVSKLPLNNYKGKHLVIIAGVGGDLMIAFIKAIYDQHKNLNIEFLLCPVHHHFELRRQLIALDFSLKHELLVEDNQRFYEIMHVTPVKEEGLTINPVGDDIWKHESNEEVKVAKQYLNKTLNHYRRIQLGNTNNVQHIIDAYQGVIL